MHLGLNFHDVAQALKGVGREKPARRTGATDPVAQQPLPATASRFSPCPAGSLGLSFAYVCETPGLPGRGRLGAGTTGSEGGVAGDPDSWV